MNLARSLVRDLVDKRLWPVALLLVVALIGVPLLLSGGGDESAALPAAAADPGTSADAAKPAVELAGPASVRSRPGRMRDPFHRARSEAARAAAGTPRTSDGDGAGTSSAPAASTGTAATTTSTNESTTTGTSAKTGKTAKTDAGATIGEGATEESATDRPAATPTKAPFAYRTEVRFGSVDGDGGKANRISRLTPLGGPDEPALVYLGVSADGKRATFVLGPAARHDGEAVCVGRGCRMIALKAGTSTVVDLTPPDGEPRQYLLQVVSVRRENMATEGAARWARAYEHPQGRGVLRDVILDGRAAQAIGAISYVQSLGVLAKSAP